MPDGVKSWNLSKQAHRERQSAQVLQVLGQIDSFCGIRVSSNVHQLATLAYYETSSLPLITLRELRMLQFMNQITDKPDWYVKVFDCGIASKWKNEVLLSPESMSEKMVDYCIAELRYNAKIYENTGLVSVFYGDVVKSDTAIPIWLQGELKASVVPLKNIPARYLDWHPGSGHKVLDLVHPSLFPLVYGQTRILPSPEVTNLEDCISRCCEGNVLPIPPEKDRLVFGSGEPLFSRRFQWLPCDVDISSDNGVRITSCINNLHPSENSGLYATIEKIIARCIPLWNATLTPLRSVHYKPLRITFEEVIFDPDPGLFDEDEGPRREEDESRSAFLERRDEWIEQVRKIVQPEPGEFVPPPGRIDDVDLGRDFGSSGLQIIVKLANIQLTPEEPSYDGGTWHVEGQLNEHICASALYYYDSVNITSSYIAFRQRSSTEDIDNRKIDYPQNFSSWLPEVFGCEDQGPAIQYVGKVDTKEGRLLTWPNILQHRVEPFTLADPTRPGHRKILALFLVDPNIRIISTANVPCQQKDWWTTDIRKKGGLAELPLELQDQVFNEVEGFPISLEEAKEQRLELMEERKRFVFSHEQSFEGSYFSLCEH
ncbi:hypothetical protein BS47DRAFT_1286740 [Hydnum rufescens UP504]|uniref:Uncharacterized protein n=1 Tax=Hydnum rufescens UP504 TaxID=1448309 RepID=A0A9P6BAP7_9AGAM|nr:hypothetical protein BS47DRAFT_1286740 [Hydnum rufescens UP504]